MKFSSVTAKLTWKYMDKFKNIRIYYQYNQTHLSV